jgi:hypothetical protein
VDAAAPTADSFSVELMCNSLLSKPMDSADRKKRGYRVVLTQLPIVADVTAEGEREETLPSKVGCLWLLEATDIKEVSGTQLTKGAEGSTPSCFSETIGHSDA